MDAAQTGKLSSVINGFYAPVVAKATGAKSVTVDVLGWKPTTDSWEAKVYLDFEMGERHMRNLSIAASFLWARMDGPDGETSALLSVIQDELTKIGQDVIEARKPKPIPPGSIGVSPLTQIIKDYYLPSIREALNKESLFLHGLAKENNMGTIKRPTGYGALYRYPTLVADYETGTRKEALREAKKYEKAARAIRKAVR